MARKGRLPEPDLDDPDLLNPPDEEGLGEEDDWSLEVREGKVSIDGVPVETPDERRIVGKEIWGDD